MELNNNLEQESEKKIKKYTLDSLKNKSLEDLKIIAKIMNISLSIKGKAKGKKQLINDIIEY